MFDQKLLDNAKIDPEPHRFPIAGGSDRPPGF
jgi:hypothetical protein